MKKILSKFDRLMSAITFAEAGLHETAREILREDEGSGTKKESRPEILKPAVLKKSY